MTALDYLPQLNESVARIIAEPTIHALIDALKEKLKQTSEAFVWSTLDVQIMPGDLPDNIKSCWLFVLKKDTPSGCHYHPNSIQHMVMIEGEGMSKVGSLTQAMKRFGAASCSLADTWYVSMKEFHMSSFRESATWSSSLFTRAKRMNSRR
jgi:hypothetical protein